MGTFSHLGLAVQDVALFGRDSGVTCRDGLGVLGNLFQQAADHVTQFLCVEFCQ
jgi:hypothetical protein